MCRDPIHPECVLECPYEVFTFQANPINPDILAGGCYNGQVGRQLVCEPSSAAFVLLQTRPSW